LRTIWDEKAKAKSKQRLGYFKQYTRRYRKKYPEYAKEYYQKNRLRIKEQVKTQRQKRKLRVLTHYGGSPPKCACCGESHSEFLSIDHINGCGTKHSERIGKTGDAFYLWLINNNFPSGYRVLCMNCNFALGLFGYCPHQKRERKNG